MRTIIVIPTEATYSSLDLFEKPPFLVTFDQSFEQKTGPLYSPTGSSLEFEIVGDRNNFIDLQKIYLEIKFRVFRNNGNDLATAQPYGHLIIDLDPKTSKGLRFSSQLIGPEPSVLYIPSE